MIHLPELLIMVAFIAAGVLIHVFVYPSVVLMVILIVLGFIIPILHWRKAAVRWQIWAFNEVRNVHELKKQAIKHNMMYSDKHFMSKWSDWTPRDREEWERILPKFEIPDHFEDDLEVPPIVHIHYDKLTNGVQLILSIASMAAPIYILTESKYGLGALGALLVGYFIVKNYREYTNRESQITLSAKGIETKESGFHSWDEIRGEDTELRGSTKHRTSWFFYYVEDDMVQVCLDDLEKDRFEVYDLLKVYRGRYEADRKLKKN